MTSSDAMQAVRQVVPPVLPPGEVERQRISEFIDEAEAYVDKLLNNGLVAPRVDLEIFIYALGCLRVADSRVTHLNRRTGVACYVLGFPMLGLDPFFCAIRLARAQADEESEMKALNDLSLVFIYTGDRDAVCENLQAALKIARKLGEKRHQLPMLGNLACNAYEMGDFLEAERFANEALNIARSMTPTDAAMAGIGTSHFALGCVFLALDNLEEAKKQAESARASHELLEAGSKNMLIGAALQLSALAEIKGGKLSNALKTVSQMRHYFAASNDFTIRHLEAMMCVAQGDVEVGLARLKDLLDEARLGKTWLSDVLYGLVWACEKGGKPDLREVYQRELATMHARYARAKHATPSSA